MSKILYYRSKNGGTVAVEAKSVTHTRVEKSPEYEEVKKEEKAKAEAK